MLMSMYEHMGNTLALQYGGSEAHSVFFDRKKGEWEATTQSKVGWEGEGLEGRRKHGLLILPVVGVRRSQQSAQRTKTK